jgi:hypothetical protein
MTMSDTEKRGCGVAEVLDIRDSVADASAHVV